MIRRSLRIGFRIGVLAGLAFALFKLVQSRRGMAALGGSEWTAPRRTDASAPPPETPLVEPTMLQGTSPSRSRDVTAGGDGQVSEPASAPRESPTGVAGQDPEQPLGDAPASPSRRLRAKPAQKATAPRAKKAAKKSARSPARSAARVWIEPKGSFCPSSHPIKAKLASGIYHLPGMAAYDRTNPDRCYKDEGAAERDGLRKAKR